MSVNVTIIGQLLSVGELQEFSSGFQKRTFKVFVKNERNEKYSDNYEIVLVGDNVKKIDYHKVGDTVVALCNVNGRDWVKAGGEPITDKNGKQINSTELVAWNLRDMDYHLKVTGGNAEQATPNPVPNGTPTDPLADRDPLESDPNELNADRDPF